MIIFGREIANRVIGLVVGGIILLLIVGFALNQCQKRRSEAAQARVERGQAGAASESAKDAIGTVRASGEREKASEELTRSNEKEIRNAEGANDPVNSAVRDAGLRSLCRRPAYRNHERCKLLVAPSR
jgi:hypothetical protein